MELGRLFDTISVAWKFFITFSFDKTLWLINSFIKETNPDLSQLLRSFRLQALIDWKEINNNVTIRHINK